jgi:prolyl 4-hydroxylase
MKMQCVLFLLLTAATVGQKDDRVSYTAFDSASWAITSDHLSSLLGTDKQVLYDTFIDGCNEEIFQGNETKRTENEMMECKTQDQYRLKMNHDQPTSVYNYTQAGYAKVRAPEALMEIVRKFWNKNKQNAEIEWKQTNVYHNTWQSPPTIVHLNKEDYSGGGPDLQEQIWDMVQPVLEEWTGQYLSPVSLYGIRLYHNNSILAPHVDRMPLVTSAIGTTR